MPQYWIEAIVLGLSLLSLGLVCLTLHRIAKLEKVGGTLTEHIRQTQTAIHQAEATCNTLKEKEETMQCTLSDTLKRATLMVQDLDFLCHRGQIMADMLEKFSEALGAMYRTKDMQTPTESSNVSPHRIAS